MRIYLDTNIIHSWFRKFMESQRRGTSFEEPAILKFIFQVKDNEYIVSDITKAEIIRYLSAEWGASKEECDYYWDRFLRSYVVGYFRVERMDFEEMGQVCQTVKTKKKTMTNLLHLQAAKNEGLWLLTGEKDLAVKYRTYYDRIITYEDFRKMHAP